MSVLPRAQATAADRARTSSRVAIAGAVVTAIALPVVSTGFTGGLPALLFGCAGLYMGLTRHLAMQELAPHRGRPVGMLSSVLPVVHATVRPEAVVRQIPVLRRHDHALVLGQDGWRVIATAPLIDVALAHGGVIDVWAMASEPRWVRAEHPVDRLPRPPYAGEVWLVTGGEPPRALTHDDLILTEDDDEARRAAHAQTSPPLVEGSTMSLSSTDEGAMR